MSLRVMLVDDEPLARVRLRRLLATASGIEVVSEAGEGREAVRRLSTEDVDLVLLDVQMPGMSGFDVIDAVGAARMPAVIFVTAYEQYAVRAFDVHAVDYLLKPVHPERLRRALQHARERLRTPGEPFVERLEALLESVRVASGAGPRHTAAAFPYLSRLQVATGEGGAVLRVSDIDWIEARRNYVRLHVRDDAYLHRIALSRLLARLPPELFARIHRSAAVNLDRVRAVARRPAGDLVVRLEDGTMLPLGRAYRPTFETRVGRLP